MKKVLIHENSERAEAFLSKINTIYLVRVRKLIASIRALGIEDITKDMLLEAIDRKLQPLQEQYRERYQRDLNVFQTEEMRNRVETAFALKFREVEKAVEDFYSPEVSNNLPFDLGVLGGIFELDGVQRVYVPVEKSEIIFDSFREFIENPELLRIYNLHNEVAKKIQDLVVSIREKGIARQNLMLGNGGLSILELFRVEDNWMDGSFTVKPRRLNYKVEPVKVEETEE
ncbi:MAG TPA: hypothetical protein DHV48_12890 [Prolixibacteraceae bacterium]|nr:hypothetical protein [Prolixibacteraceae bacterium]